MPVPAGFVSEQVMNPGFFDKRSFRTIKPNKDTQIVIGCKKGKWDPEKERCRVGTKTQAIHRRSRRRARRR